ncbi:hypothetical protein RRG08_063010 [Elysia crispata]|uniref:Uncharacterized protein n=1 Tax=Elysia crispata TaxID=231223 RepID=A0AAE1E464_9GAST|nr:hypothetical protein RRG08_063010 [Elysia crispata]
MGFIIQRAVDWGQRPGTVILIQRIFVIDSRLDSPKGLLLTRETRSASSEESALAMSAVIRETSRGNTETEESGLALFGVIRKPSLQVQRLRMPEFALSGVIRETVSIKLQKTLKIWTRLVWRDT